MALLWPKYEANMVLLIRHNLNISIGPIRLGSESFIGLACIKIYSEINYLNYHKHMDTQMYTVVSRGGNLTTL